jgi:hypothetical protein
MLRRISPLALIADKYIGQLSAPPTAHTSRVARPKPTKLFGSRKSPLRSTGFHAVQGSPLDEFRQLLHLRMMRVATRETILRAVIIPIMPDPGHSNWRSEGRTSVKLLRRSARLLESAEPIREPRKINNNMICYFGTILCVVWKKEMYRVYAIRFICF